MIEFKEIKCYVLEKDGDTYLRLSSSEWYYNDDGDWCLIYTPSTYEDTFQKWLNKD